MTNVYKIVIREEKGKRVILTDRVNAKDAVDALRWARGFYKVADTQEILATRV